MSSCVVSEHIITTFVWYTICLTSNMFSFFSAGKLKKASSGAVSRVWKDKFVELRHGLLRYEDITGWGQRSNKKTVQLIVRQVLCRPSQKYHGHVFEIRDLDNEGHIIHHHSRKKLFMAESNDDMIRWIEAIRTVCDCFCYMYAIITVLIFDLFTGNDWIRWRFWR
jgi:hypothetical protein